MAGHLTPPGRLIAVDGSRGSDTAAAAAAVAAALEDAGVACAISRFDASGLFGELAMSARAERRLSMRTLSLVYAADLAFRLRREIRPVLEAGGVVVAASYIDTAAAVGFACGVPERWIRELLRFAPEPDVRGRAHERKADRGWKARTDRGYAEFCAAMLATSSRLARKQARRTAMALLDRPVRRRTGAGAAKGRATFRMSANDADAIAKAIRSSLRAAASRRRGPSRSGRT
jgi:hypothetical protein